MTLIKIKDMKRLILAALVGVLVTSIPKSVPADYTPTSRYGGGVLSNGSNAEVLIAGTDSENRGVKSSVFYGTP